MLKLRLTMSIRKTKSGYTFKGDTRVFPTLIEAVNAYREKYK